MVNGIDHYTGFIMVITIEYNNAFYNAELFFDTLPIIKFALYNDEGIRDEKTEQLLFENNDYWIIENQFLIKMQNEKVNSFAD